MNFYGTWYRRHFLLTEKSWGFFPSTFQNFWQGKVCHNISCWPKTYGTQSLTTRHPGCPPPKKWMGLEDDLATQNWGNKKFGEIFQGLVFAVGSNSREFLPCLFPTRAYPSWKFTHFRCAERYRKPHGKLGPSSQKRQSSHWGVILSSFESQWVRILLTLFRQNEGNISKRRGVIRQHSQGIKNCVTHIWRGNIFWMAKIPPPFHS